ncbi:MAG: hypothetical protein AB1403_06360 [Candidatus Riflebacteria bacterium]
MLTLTPAAAALMPRFYPDIQAITTGTNSQQQISEKIRIPLPKSKSAISAGSAFYEQHLTKVQNTWTQFLIFLKIFEDFFVFWCAFFAGN